MYPIRTTPELETRFLLYFILSEPFVRLMVDESMRVAMPKVNRETLIVCPILVPPKSEQLEIIETLDRETARIDTLIAKAQQFIELSREHRTALIAAAVTGKIDVREMGVMPEAIGKG